MEFIITLRGELLNLPPQFILMKGINPAVRVPPFCFALEPGRVLLALFTLHIVSRDGIEFHRRHLILPDIFEPVGAFILKPRDRIVMDRKDRIGRMLEDPQGVLLTRQSTATIQPPDGHRTPRPSLNKLALTRAWMDGTSTAFPGLTAGRAGIRACRSCSTRVRAALWPTSSGHPLAERFRDNNGKIMERFWKEY